MPVVMQVNQCVSPVNSHGYVLDHTYLSREKAGECPSALDHVTAGEFVGTNLFVGSVTKNALDRFLDNNSWEMVTAIFREYRARVTDSGTVWRQLCCHVIKYE